VSIVLVSDALQKSPWAEQTSSQSWFTSPIHFWKESFNSQFDERDEEGTSEGETLWLEMDTTVGSEESRRYGDEDGLYDGNTSMA